MFFLDDDAFMEGTGFWTRGGADTRVVIDADPASAGAAAAGLTLRVRAGAVATTVTIAAGAWSSPLALAPNALRDVTLPPLAPGEDVWLITVRTGPGFRPGEHDPKSDDLRNLGVWIEF